MSHLVKVTFLRNSRISRIFPSGGLDDTIKELRNRVILPMQKNHLFRYSPLLSPPKGILLHGPPGCGKTLIAKAIANEARCTFINLEPCLLQDKWYGESQKLTSAVFRLAKKLQPCIIFIGMNFDGNLFRIIL